MHESGVSGAEILREIGILPDAGTASQIHLTWLMPT